MPDKAALDGLERAQAILAQLALAHAGEHDQCHHRYATDPDHNGKYVQCARENEAVHRCSSDPMFKTLYCSEACAQTGSSVFAPAQTTIQAVPPSR
jgi:hypothetical protein